MSRSPKICECPRHVGADRRTEPMTDHAYDVLSRYGRLVYCAACRETEPPRVIRRGKIVCDTGLVARAPRMTWTRESALEAVRSFAERNGYQPVSREAGTWNGLPHYPTARRLFGSWNGMIAAAGFEPYPPRSSTLAKRLARRDRATTSGGV